MKFWHLNKEAFTKTQKILIIIFITAVLFRIAFILTMPYLNVDSRYYDKIASNLAMGNGYSLSDSAPYSPDVNRPPLYPAFISVIYRIFGLHNYTAVRLTQALLDSFTCIVIYYIARIPFDSRASLFASALASVYPFTAIYTATLLRETLLTLLITITVLAAMNVAKNRSLKNCIFLGLFVGIGVLCKTIVLLFPLLLFFWLFFAYPDKKKTLIYAAITMIAVVVVMMPWGIRDYRLRNSSSNNDKLTFSETGGIGYDFYFGTLEYEYSTDEMVNHQDEIAEKERARDPSIGMSDGNLHYLKMGWERIKLNPVNYIINRIIHIPRVWITTFGVFNSLFLTSMAFTACILVLVLGLIGIWLAKPHWKESMPILLMIVYFTLVYFPFHAEARYTIPVRPCLLIFVAISLLQVGHVCRKFFVSWRTREKL